MIVFEEKLRELIALMPQITTANGNSTVRYDWGTEDVLNKFLLLKSTQNKYPLIWLINTDVVTDRVRNTATRKGRIIFATKTDDVDKFNEFQYKTSYSKVLIPVYDNFIKLIERSGITKIIGDSDNYRLYPNYSINDNGKGLITVWNALVLDIEIQIDGDYCLKQNIKFS
jgi:hypothetical protein